MSKWKNVAVKIIQIVVQDHGITGLGSDSRIYNWDKAHGTWMKDWEELDEPK